MLPSFRTAWLPKPNRDLMRKARLVKIGFSCAAHPEGSDFPLGAESEPGIRIFLLLFSDAMKD